MLLYDCCLNNRCCLIYLPYLFRSTIKDPNLLDKQHWRENVVYLIRERKTRPPRQTDPKPDPERLYEDLLPEKGFQAISVQDMPKRQASTAPRSTPHFPDKYALLDHSIQQMFRQEIEKRMLDACHYSDENLKSLIITVCEFVSNANSHCTPTQPQFKSLVETQVKKSIAGIVASLVGKGKFSHRPQNRRNCRKLGDLRVGLAMDT